MWFVVAGIDFFRIINFQKPIFCQAVTCDCGGEGTYYGLGYHVYIEGNFMPDSVGYKGVTHFEYFFFGIPVQEGFLIID